MHYTINILNHVGKIHGFDTGSTKGSASVIFKTKRFKMTDGTCTGAKTEVWKRPPGTLNTMGSHRHNAISEYFIR